MSDLVFVDTTAWFALKDRADSNHASSVEFLQHPTGDLITSNFVIDETVTLALYRLGHQAAREIGDSLWAHHYAHVIYVTRADQRAAWDLFTQFSDKQFSFTDCTSFVIMQRLGLTYAFAFDQHFEQIGRFVRVPK